MLPTCGEDGRSYDHLPCSHASYPSLSHVFSHDPTLTPAAPFFHFSAWLNPICPLRQLILFLFRMDLPNTLFSALLLWAVLDSESEEPNLGSGFS